MRRRLLISAASVAVAGVIGVAAIVDHRDKQARINRAELAEWYCIHAGTRCGGASSTSIEAHWNERQLLYEIGVGLFTAAAALAGGSVVLGSARRRGVPGV